MSHAPSDPPSARPATLPISETFLSIQGEGKLSGELLIIPNLPSQASRELVSRLARIKESELAGTVPPDAVKGVRDKVRNYYYGAQQGALTVEVVAGHTAGHHLAPHCPNACCSASSPGT